MRVAFVAMETVHLRDTEGNRRLDRLAHQLAEAGHDVTVFCSRWWESDGDVFEPEDVTYHALTDEPATASFCVRLPYELARLKPDVIHATSAPSSVLLFARLGGTLARAPLLVEWFGDNEPLHSRTSDLAVRAPAEIITPSEMVRTSARERGATENGTTVIPESIDMDLVREADPGETVDVVFAHSLDDSANLESLFLGLAELREKDWSATIIGDGPNRADYERQASDLRIDDRVEFVGACDRERRVEIYKGAHVFVQTAYREFFASELLWALACGCVGIVEYQARSSAHELIEHRERSFRVTSTQQMAEAIVEAGEFERLTVDDTLAPFDHESVRAEYEECYATLVDEFGWLG
ncbi:glycosyltransferase family 4 protein [Halobacteria archaeon HArc-gm2]|nr:glycosyltransferase family 4 protein [Halobacteria archaeon HArc-gm2]